MSDADKILKILLEIQSDVAALQQLNTLLGETKQKLDSASTASGGFGSEVAGAIGGLAVGAVGALVSALAEIPALYARAAEENKKMTEEIGRQGDAIIDNTQKWADMARAADNFKDVVKLGEQIAPQLASAAAQSAAFRGQELSLWKGFIDQIALLWSGIANINADALAAAKATSGNQFSLLLDSANRTLDDANKAAADAIALKAGPVDQAIAVVTGRVADLKRQLADLDPLRHPAPGATDDQKGNAAEALGFYTQANSKLKEQETLLTSLQKKQEAQTDSTHKTADTIELLTAKRKGDAEAIANAAGQKAYDGEVAAKRKLGILDQDAVAAAEEIRKLTHDSVLASEQKKSSAVANRNAAEGERNAHRDIQAILAAERLQLEAIKADIANVQNNSFLTVDAKQVALAQLLPKAIADLNQQIQQNKAAVTGSALDPSQLNAVRSAIQRDSAEITKLQTQLKTLSFGGQLQVGLTQWVNQFGTTATQVGNIITSTIGTAVSGLTNAITGLIFGTVTWGQAFAQVAQSIIQNIIQIVLQWAISRAVIFLLNLAFGQSESAAINTQASTAAAAWAPAATAASIASYGVAAGAGVAAFLAAIAIFTAGATAASSAGGFESGGYTGSGASHEPAGIVHRGEWVHDAVTVNRAGGPAFFENLKVAINRPGYERGGAVGAPSGRSTAPSRRAAARPIINQAIFLDVKAAQKWLQNRDGDKYIVDLINSRGGHLRT